MHQSCGLRVNTVHGFRTAWRTDIFHQMLDVLGRFRGEFVNYKCDEFYTPEAERGIMYNDPSLNIDWKIPTEQAIISAKDKVHPILNNANINFTYDNKF